MRNVKKTFYVPAEMEIIILERSDILTTSGNDSGPTQGSGPADDPNVDFDW